MCDEERREIGKIKHWHDRVLPFFVHFSNRVQSCRGNKNIKMDLKINSIVLSFVPRFYDDDRQERTLGWLVELGVLRIYKILRNATLVESRRPNFPRISFWNFIYSTRIWKSKNSNFLKSQKISFHEKKILSQRLIHIDARSQSSCATSKTCLETTTDSRSNPARMSHPTKMSHRIKRILVFSF